MLTKVYQFTTTVYVVGNVLNRDDNYDDTTWPYLLFPVSARPFMSMNAVEMHSRPLYSYFSIHSVDMWKHLSTHEIPPVYFSKSSALDPKFQAIQPSPNLLIDIYFLRWDFHFEEQRSALVTGEYVSVSSLNSMCWYVLECSHPIGLNGQVHTGSLNISSTQGLQAVCVSVIVVCHVHSISRHSCLSLSVWSCVFVMPYHFKGRIHPKTWPLHGVF